VDADHRWTSPTVFVGGPGDKGRIFFVLAVLASKSASSAFLNYLKESATTHSSPGLKALPAGATEYDRVEVMRS